METHDKTFYQIYNAALLLIGGLGTLAATGMFFLSPEARLLADAQEAWQFAANRALTGIVTALAVALLLFVLNLSLNSVFGWGMPAAQIQRRALWQFLVLFLAVLVYTGLFLLLPRLARG